MPFCDGVGAIADDLKTEESLVRGAMNLADQIGASDIEVRTFAHRRGRSVFGGSLGEEAFRQGCGHRLNTGWSLAGRAEGSKVRMVLDLPASEAQLMQSFKAKLRSQIRRPLKEGLVVRSGGVDLLDDFYRVFAENMRDLGSPVHSKAFIRQVAVNFDEAARVFVVFQNAEALAAGLTLRSGGVTYNPWASSLRRYGYLAPNMLLYWAMLEHACRGRCTAFDFGRSSVGEGALSVQGAVGRAPNPPVLVSLVPASGSAVICPVGNRRQEGSRCIMAAPAATGGMSHGSARSPIHKSIAPERSEGAR